MDDTSEADEAAAKRRKRTYVGLAMIAFGVTGAIVGYFNDKASLDFIRMIEAKDYAILHLVIWTIAGLGFIAWANRPADNDDDIGGNDAWRNGQ
ncbi:MAG TPA: hypothetical protein VKX28_23835 [Xanthobacteraceae bacterium]|jgi:hypothetical protein|nr:hypothetical protein [Xanthobacteraceae bacterium]